MIIDGTEQILRQNPFEPHPWLWSGGLQTIIGSRQRREFPWGWTNCCHETLTLSDGSQVAVEFLILDPDAPTLGAIHGMSGSSRSLYMQALSHKAFRRGWNFLLLNLYVQTSILTTVKQLE